MALLRRRAPAWRPERWQVTSPAGRDYVVTVEPALPESLLWARSEKSRAFLLNDRSWWVDVQSADAPWRLLRERYAERDRAQARGAALARGLEDGTVRMGRGPAWFRRRVR
jgi:hypothetical protein